MVFILSAFWGIRIRGLWKLPDGRNWLMGNLGLVLMGGAILSKSLVQFSIDELGCVPPCCLIWGHSMVEVIRIMAPPSKGPRHALPPSVPPTQQQATALPHKRLLDTHRQVCVSLLWGHCSFLLGPGAHKVLFVPAKSLFPQSCVSSGSSMVGLTVTSSKRASAIPRPAAPRAPAPVAGHCWLISLQETLMHSSGLVSARSLGPGVHKVCFSLLSISGGYEVWF